MSEEMLTSQSEITPVSKGIKKAAPEVIKSKRELAEEKLYELWQKDSKMVRGIFRNHEIPGTAITFTYHRYKYDTPEKPTFMDGKTYEVSRGLARHINEDCNYPIHHYLMDENNKPSMLVGKKVQRFSFVPTEFGDIEPSVNLMTAVPLQ